MKQLTNKISFETLFSIFIVFTGVLIIFISMYINRGPAYFTQDFVKGVVGEIAMEDVMDDPYVPGRKLGRQTITVTLLAGEYAGKSFTIANNITKGHNIYAQRGKKYIFTVRQKDSGPVVW